MKNEELVKLSPEERKKKLEEVKMELVKTNAQRATGTAPKSPALIKNLRKQIARMLTIKDEQQKEVDTKT
jgi:large subunit ribosomal protein L29